MARTTKPLTDTEVKKAKPKAKEYNLADGGGLALRIKPNGAKYWIFNYTKPYIKKRANLCFGTYPELSLKDAREERDAARALLAKSIDPKEHKDEIQRLETEAHFNTLEHVATRWFEVKKKQKNSASKKPITPEYADDIWRSLELHIFPQLGQIPIHKVTAQATIATLEPIAAKGSLETVKRLCQRLNEIMIYAVNIGLVEINPLQGIKSAFNSPTRENMPTIRPEEIPALMKAISYASIKITTRCLIEWQLHTMTRPSEAAATRWEEIDFENMLWIIPAERMKKRREHKIPLSPEAMAILERMKPISSNREYVFPADRNPRTHANSQTANMALKRMGYGGQLVSHGLRALASTALNEHGFDHDLIESALAHADSDSVRAAYNRAEYVERRREMMCWWSRQVSK